MTREWEVQIKKADWVFNNNTSIEFFILNLTVENDSIETNLWFSNKSAYDMMKELQVINTSDLVGEWIVIEQSDKGQMKYIRPFDPYKKYYIGFNWIEKGIQGYIVYKVQGQYPSKQTAIELIELLNREITFVVLETNRGNLNDVYEALEDLE